MSLEYGVEAKQFDIGVETKLKLQRTITKVRVKTKHFKN